MTTVYDWPISIVPTSQLFHVPGQAIEGGFTAGNAEILSPEPGGRAVLEMDFKTLPSDNDSRMASWLFSKVTSGAIFRIPVYLGVQTIGTAALPALEAGYADIGVPWEDDENDDVLWDGDIGWATDYEVQVTTAALEGQVGFAIDMSGYGEILLPGHVIGFDSRTYKVDTIEYDDEGIATLTVMPPLRSALPVGESITLRPSMIGRVMDPAAFRAMFDLGKWVQPGRVAFVEVLL